MILQRQTGGDLYLDKIGGLIRDGSRSGADSSSDRRRSCRGGADGACPPVFAEYYLNRYVMVLFTDPTGKKMLALGVIMQFIGALVIRKIVNIKV